MTATQEVNPLLDENEASAGEAGVPSGSRLIHVLVDGFTAFGKVWFRGQEIDVKIPSDDYQETVDRNGDSWLDMTAKDQYLRFKLQYWADGPWPGETFEDPEAMALEQKRARSPRA